LGLAASHLLVTGFICMTATPSAIPRSSIIAELLEGTLYVHAAARQPVASIAKQPGMLDNPWHVASIDLWTKSGAKRLVRNQKGEPRRQEPHSPSFFILVKRPNITLAPINTAGRE
jgi:hypothetical protein